MGAKKPSRAARKAARALLAPSPEMSALMKAINEQGKRIAKVEEQANKLVELVLGDGK